MGRNPPIWAGTVCFIWFIFVAALYAAPSAWGQDETEKSGDPASSKPAQLTLVNAAMCEEIKEYAPRHAGVAFSISAGKVSCFTAFDPVPEKTIIYHRWYHRDRPSTRKRLTLKPPRWATFSTIQLRHTDKGPWRVEIIDHENRILSTLRFSVTD